MLRLVVLLLLLAPAASAMVVDIDNPGTPIEPVREQREVKVTIEVACEEWFAAATAMSGNPFVSLHVEDAPEGLAVTHPSTVAIPQGECATPLTGTTHAAVAMRVAGMRNVPGLEEHRLRLLANLGEVADTETPFPVMMDYYGVVEAKAPIVLKQAGPQEQIAYEIELTSFSNALTRVHFEVVGRPAEGHIVLPDQVILDAKGGDQDSATAVLVFLTPFENGQNDEETPFKIKIMPEAALDPSKKANETILAFQANTKGVYAPGPGVAVLALGVLAIAARRRA